MAIYLILEISEMGDGCVFSVDACQYLRDPFIAGFSVPRAVFPSSSTTQKPAVTTTNWDEGTTTRSFVQKNNKRQKTDLQTSDQNS